MANSVKISVFIDYFTNLQSVIFAKVNIFSFLVSSAFPSLSTNKWRREFLIEIFMFYLIVPGRINFAQPALIGIDFIEAIRIKPKILKSHHVKYLLYFGAKVTLILTNF